LIRSDKRRAITSKKACDQTGYRLQVKRVDRSAPFGLPLVVDDGSGQVVRDGIYDQAASRSGQNEIKRRDDKAVGIKEQHQVDLFDHGHGVHDFTTVFMSA
jgi:hypothetical protein